MNFSGKEKVSTDRGKECIIAWNIMLCMIKKSGKDTNLKKEDHPAALFVKYILYQKVLK